MPATILPFVRRAHAGSDEHDAVAPADAPGLPERRPRQTWLPVSRPAHALPTSRQIAHRWAMLSHLARHYPRPPQPRDPLR